jgi:hypothetical protein
VAVGVADVDRAERAAIEHVGALDALAAQVVAPRLLLLGAVDHEGEVVCRADADDALRQLGVAHEGDEHPRAPVLRAEPDVARLRIVVGRPVVDDRQAHQVAVERDRALGVAADRGHVMQPAQLHALLVRGHVRRAA